MRYLLVAILLLSVAACSGITKDDLGLGRNAPDETMVEKRPLLVLPPEFDVRP